MEPRMASLETRFDTILPTLATKEDLKAVELTIHNEIGAIRKEINTNNWRMIIWMTSVVGMALTIGRSMTN